MSISPCTVISFFEHIVLTCKVLTYKHFTAPKLSFIFPLPGFQSVAEWIGSDRLVRFDSVFFFFSDSSSMVFIWKGGTFGHFSSRFFGGSKLGWRW